jgi:HAD superfamily phosphoserine phosphatase-like hydrolase
MKITCIIPAYNEETTLGSVVGIIKRVISIDEIIVVDDGSTDKTYCVAKSLGVRVFRHNVNKGKGAALKTGIAKASGDVLLFIDADLSSISPKKIASLLKPIENDEADFVKASFTRARGRVTELVVKPLFRVVFPFIELKQPLSGQFALRKELLDGIKISDRWGVDVQILLKLVKKGVRMKEVDLGFIRHKKQPLENLAVMSEEVIHTILSEMGIIANKHKLIIFDFDKTLIKENSIDSISKDLGIYSDLTKLRERNIRGKVKDYELPLSIAKLLKGKSSKDLEKSLRRLTITKNAERVLGLLRKRGYETAIVSVAFYQTIVPFADRLGISRDNIIAPILVEDRKGIFTGEVIAKTKHNSKCCYRIICKAEAVKDLMKARKVTLEECVAVADGQSDECLFGACGLSLAFKPKKPMGDAIITNFAEVLIYAD